MGFLGRLFGSPGSLNKAVETGINALDKIYYSDEEKADDAARAKRELADQTVKWMHASSGQNLTRRFLAMALFMMWAVVWSAHLLVLMEIIPVTDYTATTTILEMAVSELNTPIVLILTFYFSLPHLDKVIRPVLERMTRRKNVGS